MGSLSAAPAGGGSEPLTAEDCVGGGVRRAPPGSPRQRGSHGYPDLQEHGSLERYDSARPDHSSRRPKEQRSFGRFPIAQVALESNQDRGDAGPGAQRRGERPSQRRPLEKEQSPRGSAEARKRGTSVRARVLIETWWQEYNRLRCGDGEVQPCVS